MTVHMEQLAQVEPTSEVAGRLAWSVGARFTSVRAFQRAVAKTGARGTSYPSVHGYLHGTTKPPLEFIHAAAEVLCVSASWLATGKEAPVFVQNQEPVLAQLAVVERELAKLRALIGVPGAPSISGG